jgi:LacI family transcriptional regulator
MQKCKRFHADVGGGGLKGIGREAVMSVTIRDVARVAEVSVATVSRVMNASAAVRPETRRRVLDVARDLRFHPNGAARSLSTQRTHALGVILPDLYGEFFSELLRGMDHAAQRHEHHLLVSSSHHDRRGLETAVRAMHGRVDGLLVMAPDVEGDALLDLFPPRLPAVLLNGGEIAALPREVRSVTVDNYAGAHAMTRHLLALGHRRIGFIAGAARNVDAGERERGYREAMRDARSEHEELIVRGDFAEAGGWRCAEDLVALADRPTAIFCANDAMAIGALSALRAAAIAVPGQVAVVGFDDIPVAQYLNPPLTSVRVGIADLGERAVTLLLHALAERAPPTKRTRHEVLATTLVIRGSCGAAASASRAPVDRSPSAIRRSVRRR